MQGRVVRGRWCCVALDQGMLSWDPRPSSDHQGQLVERDCHSPVQWFLSGQLVMPTP
jgi:hypothetical protein